MKALPLLSTCFVVFFAFDARAELLSYFVTDPIIVTDAQPGGVEFHNASVTVPLDPTRISWIAWNFNDVVSTTHPDFPGETFLGGMPFGVDDFIRLTISTQGFEVFSADIDQNNNQGTSVGQQAVIFGAPEATPDVLRETSLTNDTPMILDEAGIFTFLPLLPAGDYTFEFSFRNVYAELGHVVKPVYLLVASEVPEPATGSLATLAVIVFAVVRRAMLLRRQ